MKKKLSLLLVLFMMLTMFTGCGNGDEGAAEEIGKTVEGVGSGYGGEILLEVQIHGEEIKSINIIDHQETEGISDMALEEMPKKITETQSLSVDAVSGATLTSEGILEAVANALEAAGLNPDDFMKEEEARELKQGDIEETDIVIVGAGIAGIMAAMELEEHYPELDFILLEKLPVFGGAIITTGGAIFAVDSYMHEEEGIEATDMEDLIAYMEDSSRRSLNRELLENTFAFSEDTLNWYLDLGLPVDGELQYSSPHSEKLFAAWTEGRGQGLYRFLEEMVAERDFDLRLNSEVTELIVEDGEVIGVRVEDQDAVYEIHAKKTLLSTGGFGSNEELMERYAEPFADGVISTHGGATGDGFTMTEVFGTEVVGDGTMGTIVAPDGSSIINSTFMVNSEGRRFHNERDISYRVQRAIAEYADSKAFFISIEEHLDPEHLEQGLESGMIEKFEDLETLAQEMGIEKEALIEEVEAYGEALAEGKSPGYDLDPEEALALEGGPYYVSPVVVRTFGTIPGIHVSPRGEVLDGEGEVVPNLFAAGELIAGNAFSYQYPGAGMGISFAANTGRLIASEAGKSLVE